MSGADSEDVLKICGGAYYEQCVSPEWDRILGSGGRAAAVLSEFLPNIQLITYATADSEEDLKASLASFDIDVVVHFARADYTFEYLHPLSRPTFYSSTSKLEVEDPIDAEADCVLRFGFIEGDAKVQAKRAIYDPQSSAPELFEANGSRADELAYVLNGEQLLSLGGADDPETAAANLLASTSTVLVVAKLGPYGVKIYSEHQQWFVPCFRTNRVFKIGSGDVFSAMFAYQWGHLGIEPEIAANLASKATATYCGHKTLPITQRALDQVFTPAEYKDGGSVYIAAPFFTIGQRWLLEECRAHLLSFGVRIFSPLHEIGFGSPTTVAPQDLEGLDLATAVLVIADGRDLGSIFEVGYAIAKRKRVVVFAECLADYEKTMLVGTGCELVDDLASALYKVTWEAIR